MDDTIGFFKYQHSTVYWIDSIVRCFKWQRGTVFSMNGTARWFKYQRGTVIEWTAQVDVSNDSIAQSSG